MYAYIHYEMDILSSRLIELLPLELMLEQYYLGHEMDKSVYLNHISELFKKPDKVWKSAGSETCDV